MQTHVERLNATTVRLRIKIPSQDIMPRFLEGLNKANIVLSEPTKDKPKLVKSNETATSPFAIYVRRDVCNEVMKTKFPQAAQQAGVLPVSKPQFESEVWQENTDFVFSATFEVRPQISFVNLSTLKVTPNTYKVTEAMINESIFNLQKTQQVVTEDQLTTIAGPGTTVLIDVDAYKGGVLFQTACVRDQLLEIKKTTQLTPVEKSVLGMRRFEERAFDFTFPLDYQEKSVAGHKIVFHVKLKDFKKVTLPKLDDSFVTSCFQGAMPEIFGASHAPKTVAELNAYLHSEIDYRQRVQYFNREKNSILNQLVMQNQIEVPKGLVEGQFQALVQFEKVQFNRTMPLQNFDMHLSLIKSKLMDHAVWMVRSALIIDHLSQKFKIRCEESDFEKYFDEKSREQIKKKDFIKRTMNFPQNRGNVAYAILEDKVVQFLINLNGPKLKVA